MAKKCTKNCDARVELLFCQSKTYCFFAVLIDVTIIAICLSSLLLTHQQHDENYIPHSYCELEMPVNKQQANMNPGKSHKPLQPKDPDQL